MKTFRDYGINLPDNFSGNRKTVCPKCSSTRRKRGEPCLSVNGDDGVWNCHHCGWSGGLGKVEYVRPEETSPDISHDVVKWFAKRGISEDTLIRNRVSSGVVYMPQIEKKVNAIEFKYYKNDVLVNIKYRDSNKNFKQVANAEHVVYGYDDISSSSPIVIVEGEIDKLSLSEAGYDNCFSIPDGAPSPNTKLYAKKFAYLGDIYEVLQDVDRVIIATDDDEPGIKLRDELGRRIGREKCYVVSFPRGCKDMNDVLVNHGVDAVIGLIENAYPMPVEGVFSVGDIRERVLELYDRGLQKGISTGWDHVDRYYTIRPGEWTLVTGIPGSGKSVFLDNMMMNMVQNHDWRIGMFSPENLPLERHCAKLIEQYSNMPFVDGFVEKMSKADVGAVMSMLEDSIYFIMPEEDDINLDSILRLARVLVYRHGINGLVIDPWNEIEHAHPREINEVEYISQALSKIRRFARRYSVHIWVVAHPTKLRKDENGKYPVPTPYDVAGAAHFRNKADNALAIYRDFETNEVTLHIQKIRFREVGMLGSVPLKYNQITGKYS